MPPNPLARAHKDAQRVDRELAALFGRYLGGGEHPRGRVLSAYRQGRRAMRSVYAKGGPLMPFHARDVLEELRQTLHDIAYRGIVDSVEMGRNSAQRQVGFYQRATGQTYDIAGDLPDLAALRDGWTATIDGQVDRTAALVASGADPALIYGDADRMGAMMPAPVNKDGAHWLATAAGLAFLVRLIGRNGRKEKALPFQRQAIAAIDTRTTDCCLRVHGQVVKMRGKFKLTGTPRYADKMRDPPFHWWCRTSVVLYLPGFDDGLTAALREAARAQLGSGS